MLNFTQLTHVWEGSVKVKIIYNQQVDVHHYGNLPPTNRRQSNQEVTINY